MRVRLRTPLYVFDRGPALPALEEWSRGTVTPSQHPTIGVAIGTYGSPPYVTLSLEVRKRFWPSLPVLVHDDSSPESGQLAELCSQYPDVEFACTYERHGWSLGDMAAIVAGLDWARRRDLDFLVKISRRFIIHHDWVPAFQGIAFGMQYATYSGGCAAFDMPIRPECLALNVKAWHESGAVAELKDVLARKQRAAGIIEKWYQQLTLRVHLGCAPQTLQFAEFKYGRGRQTLGYGHWHILGLSRPTPMPGVLWHDANAENEYYELARELGLAHLSLQDFMMPTGETAVAVERRIMAARNSDFESHLPASEQWQ